MTPGRQQARQRSTWIAAGAAFVFAAGACGDAGPASGPGVLTARVVSPNGAEGAALVTLVGPGIEGIAAAGGRVFSEVHGDTVVVVVVNEAGGDLSFDVSLADTTRLPTGALVEVSGPDDRIRALTGYSVEIRR